MAHTQRSSSALRPWYRSAFVAVALTAVASVGGCAGTSGIGGYANSSGATQPYKVAGPVVSKTPTPPAEQACSGSVSSLSTACSGFARYFGP